MRRILVGAVLLVFSLAVPAEQFGFPLNVPGIYISDGWRPARLSDCPFTATATMSTSRSILGPWKRYCYWGSNR